MPVEFVRPPLIAFGTLSNGASAQLLARTPAAAVIGEEAGTIETMFENVRSRIGPRTESAFAFLPLGGQGARRWGLCRFDPMGKGAIGWCGVIWSLLLDRDMLDAIGWGVHGLMGGFPPPRLPEPGETLAVPAIALDQRPLLAPAACKSFDLIAKTAGTTPAVLLVMPPPAGQPPLSNDAALHILWSRKLPQWRRHSFVSWSGLGADFDLVAVSAAADGTVDASQPDTAPLTGRLTLPVAAGMPAPALALADEIERAVQGLAFDPRPADADGDYASTAAQIVTFLMANHADAGAVFGALANELRRPALARYRQLAAPAFALALEHCLDEDDQGGVVKAFFAAVDTIEGLWATTGFAARCAATIIAAAALPALAPAAIARFRPALLGPVEAPLLVSPAAIAQLAAAANLDWQRWWPLAEKAMARRPAPQLAAAAAAALAGTDQGQAALGWLIKSPVPFWPQALADVRQPARQRQRAIAAAMAPWMAHGEHRLRAGGMAWLRRHYIGAASAARRERGTR